MQKLEAAIGRFVIKAAPLIEGQLEDTLQDGIQSGKVYRRGKSRYHQASAPGEPPATDLNNLVGSIDSIIAANRLEAKIGTPVEYALFLEDGTSRMAPRPLWEKTVKDNLPTLENLLKDEIRKMR